MSNWNSFVSASPWGDILQFEQWGKTKTNEGWNYDFVQSDDQHLRSMVLWKKASFLGNYLYVPHGPVFQSAEDLESSIESWKVNLLNFARSKKCFVVEIEPKVGKYRLADDKSILQTKNEEGLKHFFDPGIVEIFKKAGFRETGRNMQPKYKLLYSLALTDEELMSLMSKTTRYNIGYAERKGVEVKEYLADDPLIGQKIEEFYNLLLETQKRVGGYPIRPLSSFHKLFENFKGTDNISLFEASFAGEVIAMNISQRTKSWASSFYAGSNRLHPKVKAPYLLRWRSIQRAKAYGSKVYDFWGIIPHSASHKGYSDHKLSFGGIRIDHVGLMQLPVDPIRTNAFNYLAPLPAKLAGFKRKIF